MVDGKPLELTASELFEKAEVFGEPELNSEILIRKLRNLLVSNGLAMEPDFGTCEDFIVRATLQADIPVTIREGAPNPIGQRKKKVKKDKEPKPISPDSKPTLLEPEPELNKSLQRKVWARIRADVKEIEAKDPKENDIAKMKGPLEETLVELNDSSKDWVKAIGAYAQALWNITDRSEKGNSPLGRDSYHMVLAALQYLIDPNDIIPDDVIEDGYLDDAYAINYCLKKVEKRAQLMFINEISQ